MDLKNLEHNAENVVVLLKALSNEKRLMILCALYHEEKSVGALEQRIGLRQSALSQHLARLRRDGLVETRRQAQTIFYSLADDTVRDVIKTLCDIAERREA